MKARGATLPGRRVRGGTLLGILIGIVIGLALAAAVAWVVNRSPNPFDGKSGKTDVVRPNVSSIEKEPAKAGEKPRFDFSKILPGTDERKPARTEEPAGTEANAGTAQRADFPPAPPAPPTPADAKGKLFLQAGAFQSAADAEDQRAKLALMGIEATLQAVDVPDKGKVNRVRLGPYGSVEEMNQVKAELSKRGISTAVIKNP